MKRYQLEVGTGSQHIVLEAVFIGKDLAVNLYGGDLAHIGAVAVAQPRPSLSGDGSTSSSASVICISGHKEDLLARQVALRLSALWNCHVSVTAGIHVDFATTDELKGIGAAVEELLEKFIATVDTEESV